jgi:hypothetical protein
MVSIQMQGEAGSSLQVLWDPRNRSELRDGDEYRVQVEDAEARTILSIRESITHYVSYRPNGSDCEPECRRIEIDRRVGT